MSLANMLRPRVCELGKIKIGGLGEERTSKAGNKYRAPMKYDEFHITTLNRDEQGLLIDDTELMASLPKDSNGKLTSIPVSLLSNNMEEVMQAAYLWYNGKRLAGKSDGETLTTFFDHKTGKWLDKPKIQPWVSAWADLKFNNAPMFKLHCTLNVLIASASSRFGGLYKFRTTSRITSDQMYGSLVQLRQLTGGVLRGLPLRLVVRPMQVSPDGKPTTIYVVHVELQGNDIAALQARALELAQFEVKHVKELAAAQTEYKRLLAAPDDFSDDAEEAEVAQEFAPHQQDDQPGRMPESAPVGDVATEDEEGSDPTSAAGATASDASATTSQTSTSTTEDEGEPWHPAVGDDFAEWISHQDADFVDQGLCSAGAVTARIMEGGARKGLSPDFTKWNKTAIELAVATVDQLKESLSRPEFSACRAEILRTGTRWVKCVSWLNTRFGTKYEGKTQLYELSTEQLVALTADLKTHPDKK